jgi:hypothetical protein
MTKVQIELDEQDFERLWINSMLWNGVDWEKQEERFIPKPSFAWKFAYWYDDYSALKMGESYLKAINEDYAIHSDEEGDWVIVSNFASPCHR